MKLVVDSGSTKADWALLDNGTSTIEFVTKGFNPFFHDRNFILPELNSNSGLVAIKNQVTHLYFFGAGCSSPQRNKIIHEGLVEFFTNAKVIVEHDMLGSALAVCEGAPGLACILGTGSNICYFNGKEISETRHGLGYVLGDEGSGSYYGKKLLSSYLYGVLPGDLEDFFRDTFHLEKEDIIRKVYNEPGANVFLASFATFLSTHSNHEYIKKMVYKGMSEYFETNVLSYPESAIIPVHFVGSIAWYFKEILVEVATQKKVITGNIIQKPIQGLSDYFLKGGVLHSS